MNIFCHVLEDITPASSTIPKAVLDAAREAITSPIKKRVGSKNDLPSQEATPEPKTAKGICTQ